MTEAELILADLVLMKLPIGRQLDVPGFMGSHLLEGKQDQIPQSELQGINKIIATRSDVIRTFLIKEKYIAVVNHMVPWDILTDKGHKAQELGGHSQYIIWDKKIKKYKKLKEVAFWILFIASIVSAAYAVVSYHFNDKTKNQSTLKLDSTLKQAPRPPSQTLLPDTTKAQTAYSYDQTKKIKFDSLK